MGNPVLRFLSSFLSQSLPSSLRLRWVLAVVLLLHVLLSAAIGLSVDEAHYALYAAHPAWSYFDHPPLVGWVQWPLVVLDAPVVALRLIPGLLWLATVLLVYRIAEVLCLGAGVGALLSLLLAPLLHVLAIGLLPDTLLMFFSAALMYQTLLLMHCDAQQAWRHWLVLGILLGLAGLSKYTAIFTAVAVAACLMRAQDWRVLRNAKLWVSVTIAVALVLPVAYWNAQNQWISFTYQAKHGAGGDWEALHVARFLIVQVLSYGVLLWWGWAGVRSLPSSKLRWLLGFFLVPFTVFAALSGGGSGLPHWTAPAWVALAPFAGAGLVQALQGAQRRWVVGVMCVQAVLCIALPLVMASGGMPFMQGRVASAQSSDPPNPFADVHGWDLAGATALQLAQAQGLDSVSVQNWTLGSRIGWYARPLKVHVLEDRFDQFDLWAGDLPAGGNTLLVDWSQMSYEVPLGTHGFAQCTPLAQQTVRKLGYALAEFRFFACTGWSGNPQPSLRHDNGGQP
jgi:hypothetical protein